MHIAVLYWPLVGLQLISHSILKMWRRSITRWKLNIGLYPSLYGLPTSKPIYPVKTELKVDTSTLPKTKIKKKKGWLEGKSLGFLFRVTNFLATILKFDIGPFQGFQVNKDLKRPILWSPYAIETIDQIPTKALM